MLVDSYPYINFGLRHLGIARSMREAATEVIEIQSEELQEVPAITYRPGQLDKVTKGCGPLDIEFAYLANRRRRYPAVLRYKFENCLVHQAGFDVPAFGFRIQRFRPNLKSRCKAEVDSGIYTMTSVCHEYFGHWLQDACATALLQRPEDTLFLDTRSDWRHAKSYVEMFGYSPAPPATVLVRELFWYQDHGQGSSKRGRYAQLRARAAAAVPQSEGFGKAIYLRRGASGIRRVIANEQRVTEELVKNGFYVLDVDKEPVPVIYSACRNADLIFSVEGSHMNHIYMAMPPGGRVLCAIPGDRFTLTQSGYAEALDLKFGFVVMEPDADGYRVDINDLLTTINLMGR